MIVVICPRCQTKSQAPDAAHGRCLACPKCAKSLIVGSDNAEPEPPEPEPPEPEPPEPEPPEPEPSEPEPLEPFFESDKPESDLLETPPAITPTQKSKPSLQHRFQKLVFSNHRKPDNEFRNLKTVLAIYQILLIIALSLQSIGWVIWCFAGAGTGAVIVSAATGVEAVIDDDAQAEYQKSLTNWNEKTPLQQLGGIQPQPPELTLEFSTLGHIAFWVVGILVFVICGMFAGLIIWLQYIFAMAFIDFVRVIVAIERNTRLT